MYLKVNSDLLQSKKSDHTPQELNLTLDSDLYRENSQTQENPQLKIQNEESSINKDLIESSHSEYLSYKSSNYYEIKNNLRKNAYFGLNIQCPILSIPGLLDVFADSESGRVLIKLHLSDANNDHKFQLFRSNGSLRRHLWKLLTIQINEDILQVFLDSILDTRIKLSDHDISFRESKKQDSEKFKFFRKKSNLEFQHNGIIIGNIDRLHKKPNFDDLKYNQVYQTYNSKSLLDKTNLEYFQQSTKVLNNQT